MNDWIADTEEATEKTPTYTRAEWVRATSGLALGPNSIPVDLRGAIERAFPLRVPLSRMERLRSWLSARIARLAWLVAP